MSLSINLIYIEYFSFEFLTIGQLRVIGYLSFGQNDANPIFNLTFGSRLQKSRWSLPVQNPHKFESYCKLQIIGYLNFGQNDVNPIFNLIFGSSLQKSRWFLPVQNPQKLES